jgi:hypothetical protein
MSRPKKAKKSPTDRRVPFKPWPDTPAARKHKRTKEEQDQLTEQFRTMALDSHVDKLHVDPLEDEPLAADLAPLIRGNFSESDKEIAAELFILALAGMSADDAESFFKRIVKLKRTHEGLVHPAAWVMLAYRNYMTETHREPSKQQLREYICARSAIYKAHPPADDKSGWRDLWKQSGLFDLPSKVGKKP